MLNPTRALWRASEAVSLTSLADMSRGGSCRIHSAGSTTAAGTARALRGRFDECCAGLAASFGFGCLSFESTDLASLSTFVHSSRLKQKQTPVHAPLARCLARSPSLSPSLRPSLPGNPQDPQDAAKQSWAEPS